MYNLDNVQLLVLLLVLLRCVVRVFRSSRFPPPPLPQDCITKRVYALRNNQITVGSGDRGYIAAGRG